MALVGKHGIQVYGDGCRSVNGSEDTMLALAIGV